MAERCHDCAFTHGTDASNSPHTVVVANMCAITGEVFHCHINKAPCAGWAEARVMRIDSPIKPEPLSTQTAGMLCDLVSECIRLAKSEDEKHATENR